MRRITELIGMPAVDGKTGKTLFPVEKLCLDRDRKRLSGMLLRKNGKRFLPMEHVLLIGEKAIIVEELERMPKNAYLWQSGEVVFTAGGEQLGWLTDLKIEEQNGTVCQAQVSLGLWDDMVHGRVWLDDFSLHKGNVIAAWRENEGKEEEP